MADDAYSRGKMLTSEWRQRIWCGGIALVISGLAALSASTYVTSNVQTAVQRVTLTKSLQNCQAIASGRIAGNQFRFAVREELSFIPALVATAEREHTLTKQSRQFLAAQVQKLNADLAHERLTVPGLPTHIENYGDLFGLLADQPLVTCKGFR